MRFALAVLLLTACTRTRGDAELGSPCRSDFDCALGYCAGASGHTLCVPTCAHDSECPEGWSCHGVTNNGVVVCAPGDAVPIPH